MTTKNKQISSKFTPWFMWGCGAFFYFYQFIIKIAPSNLREELSFTFDLNASNFGFLASFSLIAYTILQIPLGLWLSQWGSRRVLLWSIFLTSVGALVMGNAPNFQVLCIGRLITGVGSASAFIGAFKVAHDWFRPRALPVITGITCSIGVIGASIGGVPIVLLNEYMGWRNSFMVVSILGMLFFLVFFMFFQDHPDSKAEKIKFIPAMKEIIASRQMWLLGAYGLALYTPVSVLADLWGPSFIKEAYNMSSVKAALISSFLYYGNATGSFVIGWIMRKFISLRVFFATFAFMLTILITSTVWLKFDNHNTVFAIFFTLGFLVACEGMVFPLGSQLVKAENAALSAGSLNFVVTLGAAIFQPLIGRIMDMFWEGLYKDGIPYYTTQNYQYGLTVLIVSIAIAIVLSFWIKEQKE